MSQKPKQANPGPWAPGEPVVPQPRPYVRAGGSWGWAALGMAATVAVLLLLGAVR